MAPNCQAVLNRVVGGMTVVVRCHRPAGHAKRLPKTDKDRFAHIGHADSSTLPTGIGPFKVRWGG